MKKELFKSKRMLILVVIIPILALIFLAPEFKYIYNTNKTSLKGIKNKSFKNYLSKNENKFSNSCLSRDDNIVYYSNIYSQIIDVVFNMNKEKYISEDDKNKIFKLIKNSNINELFNKINNINMLTINTDSLAKYNYLKALIGELTLSKNKNIEFYYKKAIKTNQFEPKYYFQLAKFYRKSCKYDEAIETLLKTSSMSMNTTINNNLCGIYSMLGDLYFEKRDYENSLVYYVDALVNLDYRNKEKQKVTILMKLGDIMSIRGEYFEAINYYKYALSINDKKISKNGNITLFLRLASAYYSYGNYENSLKFAKSALKVAKKLNNKLLSSKSKYYICLNYEYLGKPRNETEKICKEAVETAEEYKNEVGSLDSYTNLASILDFSAHVRDAKKATDYLQTALKLNYQENVYNEISILESIAGIKSYSNSKDSKFEALKIFNTLGEYYNKYNVGIGCCTNLLTGFVKEQLNMESPEIDYLSGEKNLKNRKANLSTLYSYLSDYYKNKNQNKLSLYYAKKSLELNRQIYKFNHHYIKYANSMVENLEKTK